MNTRLISAVMGLITIACVNTASAAAFDVKVRGHVTRAQGVCPDGAVLCGTADVEGFGDAEYRWFLVDGAHSEPCGPRSAFVDYGAIVTFTLSDGSKLTLHEVGTLCTPGNSFPTGGPESYGNPRFFGARWQVLSGTGQFAGLTGSGTSSGTFAGAAITANYRGTLSEGNPTPATLKVRWDIIVNDAPGTCEEVGGSYLRLRLSGTGSKEFTVDCDQKSAEFVVDPGVYTVEIELVDIFDNVLSYPITWTVQALPGTVFDLGFYHFSFSIFSPRVANLWGL